MLNLRREQQQNIKNNSHDTAAMKQQSNSHGKARQLLSTVEEELSNNGKTRLTEHKQLMAIAFKQSNSFQTQNNSYQTAEQRLSGSIRQATNNHKGHYFN